MTSRSNKARVFVSLYFRPGVTRHPDGAELGYARFHWGIWVEPKGSQGIGIIYQVFYEPPYSNVAGSGGWKFYKENFENKRADINIMGRIMVEKIPNDVKRNR
jgi:hypothetical protein